MKIVIEELRILGKLLEERLGYRSWTERQARSLAGEVGIDKTVFDMLTNQILTYSSDGMLSWHWKIAHSKDNRFIFLRYATMPEKYLPLKPVSVY